MGRRLGNSERAVGSWEKEGKIPHTGTLIRIASLFGESEERVLAIARGQPVPEPQRESATRIEVSEETGQAIAKLAEELAISKGQLIERIFAMVVNPKGWLRDPLSALGSPLSANQRQQIQAVKEKVDGQKQSRGRGEGSPP